MANKLVNPNAREAMDRFKMESASEVGVPLKQGYNGNLTSAQAGSIGGNMVKKITPIRTMSFDRVNRITYGHSSTVKYVSSLST